MQNKPALFSLVAPEYYARNLPVIPLQYHDKRPIPQDWSRFHNAMPTTKQQEEWLQKYPYANIGLVLGEQSGLLVIDIDTVNPKYIDIIMASLPPSPWKRVGKKGCVLAYRYSGQPTFRIRDLAGNSIVECLSSRTQVVLPPSIHPSTLEPYTANADLYDVLDQLPVLDKEIEGILRTALKEAGIELSHSGWSRVTEWVPQGVRDVKMTQTAGLLAYAVLRGERTLLEALDMLRGWYSQMVEKVTGDDVDIEKGIQSLVRFLVRDVLERGKVLPRGWDTGLSEEDIEKLGLNLGEDHHEWTNQQLKEYIREQFTHHADPDSVGRMQVIDYALRKLAKSTTLTTLDEENILRFISDTSGPYIHLAALRKRVNEIRQGEIKGVNHAEIAEAAIRDYEQTSRLSFAAGQFWEWTGAHWTPISNNAVLRPVINEYGHLPAARRNSDHRGILNTMATLVPQQIQSMDLRGINFANGVLMENLELKPHDPAYGMTYTLPFRYLPDYAGKAFRWQQFLERSWGHHEDYQQRVDALQEAICATLFGMAYRYQRVFLLHGPPATGKSTILQIITAMLPPEARCQCPPDQWGDKFAPALMFGKLLNVCGELSEHKRIDGQKFKEIVEGTEISAQFKNKPLFHFSPTCAHWFASNHYWRTDDSSAAFNRRWLIFEFDKPVTMREKILGFADHLVAEEREAIVAWAVEAMPRLRAKQEYTIPQSHIESLREVSWDNNTVRFFIQRSGQVLVVGTEAGGGMSETDLHKEYWSFCLGVAGVKPVGPRAFRHRMRELMSEIDIQMESRPGANGIPEVNYVGIVPAKRRAM